jgi:hypothetical protein
MKTQTTVTVDVKIDVAKCLAALLAFLFLLL